MDRKMFSIIREICVVQGWRATNTAEDKKPESIPGYFNKEMVRH